MHRYEHQCYLTDGQSVDAAFMGNSEKRAWLPLRPVPLRSGLTHEIAFANKISCLCFTVFQHYAEEKK